MSGIDAPEEHYVGSRFKLEGVEHSLKPGQQERSQPLRKPATDYLLNTLQETGDGLIELDRDILDNHGRVPGYVWESDKSAVKGKMLSLELVRRGLAFGFPIRERC